MATSNGLTTDGCYRCQRNEASIECNECLVENKSSLYCDECYLLVHKGGLSKHNSVSLTTKILSELESRARALENSLSIEKQKASIETECERQKMEIDLHLTQAQNEVKTACNALRNTIDTQESTLMLNISQIRNVRHLELEDLRLHAIESLLRTEKRIRDSLEKLRQVTPETPKPDLLMIKHQLELVERSGQVQTPVLPCISCVSLPDTKRLEKAISNCLTTMPINNLWKINISKDIKVVYIQESSCRFFLMDRQLSPDQVHQAVFYHHYRIQESFRSPLTPLTSPSVGQLCIVVSKNNCLMRAIIEGVSDDKHKVKVFYLDIGESGIVDNSQKPCVFPLEDKLLFYPFTCYYCQIDLDYDSQDRTIERQIRWFIRDLTPNENGLSACLKKKEFLKSGIALHYIEMKDNDSTETESLMAQLQERIVKAGMGRNKPDTIKFQDIRVQHNSHEGVLPAPSLKPPQQIDPAFGYPADMSLVQLPAYRTMPYIPAFSYQQPSQMPSIYYPNYIPMTAVKPQHPPSPLPPPEPEASPSPVMPSVPTPLLIPEEDRPRPRVPVGAKAVTNSISDEINDATHISRQESSPEEPPYGDVDLEVEELEWEERAWKEIKNMENSFWKTDLESKLYMKLATTLDANGTFWSLHQHTQDSRLETFDHLFEELQSYAGTHSTTDKHAFKVGHLCAAQFYLDKRWYRALVECLEGKAARVRFLDYGNSQMTQLEHLLYLPPQFCQLPFQAVLCSINFTTEVVITKTRRARFKELLQDSAVKYFSCTVKKIEGPVHYLQMFIPSPDNPEQIVDVNEEVFLSDLHVPNMELANQSWADAMKSPITPDGQAPQFPASSATSDRTLSHFKNHKETNEDYNERRHETATRPSEYNSMSRSSYQNRGPPRENNQYPGTGGQFHQPNFHQQQQNRHSYQERSRSDQGRQNWRQGAGEPWRGEYSRPKPMLSSNPSLYIKCDFFSNIQISAIVQTMEKILNGLLSHVQNIVPDTKSGAPIVFLDIDTHEHAMKIMNFLNDKVRRIEDYELRAELARRYKQYLEMGENKFS